MKDPFFFVFILRNIEHTQLRSLTFLREKLYRQPLEYLQPVRENCSAFVFRPRSKKDLSLVDMSFALRDSPRPLKKKVAMSPSSAGHVDQYDAKHSPLG